MINNSAKPKNLQILIKLVNGLAERGDIDINAIILASLAKVSVKHSNIWKFFYKFLKQHIPSCQRETQLLILQRILEDVGTLPTSKKRKKKLFRV